MSVNQTMDQFATLLKLGMGDQLITTARSFTEMLADDAVMEFPYAPPGLPQRLESKAVIEKYLEAFGNTVRIERFSSPVIHRTLSAFVLEFNCTGVVTKTGKAYNQQYVSVITLRDGRITHYRDYWNPIILLSAIDAPEMADKETV